MFYFKKLLQNQAIPTWLRALVPLVFTPDGELLFIPGVKKSASFEKYFGADAIIEWRYANYFEVI